MKRKKNYLFNIFLLILVVGITEQFWYLKLNWCAEESHGVIDELGTYSFIFRVPILIIFMDNKT